MGYRKIKKGLIHSDSLMEECGLFKDTIDKPYQCLSHSKHKQEPGRCCIYDCPLAFPADIEDMKEYDKDLYEEYKAEESDPSSMGSGWMVQYQEVV